MTMPSRDPEELRRAKSALARLEILLARLPEISLIDVGLDPQAGEAGRQAPVVLRVHLRQDRARSLAELVRLIPAEVDGVPVRILAGDYYPEGNEYE